MDISVNRDVYHKIRLKYSEFSFRVFGTPPTSEMIFFSVVQFRVTSFCFLNYYSCNSETSPVSRYPVTRQWTRQVQPAQQVQVLMDLSRFMTHLQFSDTFPPSI